MGELHGGQVVHDGDVDEAVGVLHDAEDGLKVWSPASGAQRGRRTLTQKEGRNEELRVDHVILSLYRGATSHRQVDV